MSSFFKPYEGTRPFLFISYAHRQSDEVVETIRILHEKGYRLWYDEGIPAGSDWPANIAQHMRDCEKVVFFLSERAMESPNCYSEMRTAVRSGKPILVVRLEDVPVEERWKEILDGKAEIPILNTPAERAEAILQAGFVQRRFRRSRLEGVSFRAAGLAASLLFFLAAAAALALLATGKWDPVPPGETPSPQPSVTTSPDVQQQVDGIKGAERLFAVKFPDWLQETAVRNALGVSDDTAILKGDLGEIKELYLCGNTIADGIDAIEFSEDGTCTLTGSPLILGPVSDLSLLKSAVRLEKLALICQPLESLSSLDGHVLLQDLDLAGSTVSNLSELKELPSLQVIRLEHTNVSDLTPLEALPALKTVTVSRGMLPLQWSKDADFTVILVP